MATIALRTISLDERGVAVVTGTGIKVKEIVIDKIHWNMSPEDMLLAHSIWSLPVIYAALSYYYDHQSEIDAQIENDIAWVEQQRQRNPNTLTRQELLRRLDTSEKAS